MKSWIPRPFTKQLSLFFLWIYLRYLSWIGLSTTRRASKTSSRWSFTRKVKIKIWYYIILFYSSVILGSGFHIPNYLEIKKIVFQISGFYVPKYLNWKLSNFLKFLFSSIFSYFLYMVNSMDIRIIISISLLYIFLLPTYLLSFCLIILFSSFYFDSLP